jgi:hypothetical protein
MRLCDRRTSAGVFRRIPGCAAFTADERVGRPTERPVGGYLATGLQQGFGAKELHQAFAYSPNGSVLIPYADKKRASMQEESKN